MSHRQSSPTLADLGGETPSRWARLDRDAASFFTLLVGLGLGLGLGMFWHGVFKLVAQHLA